MLDLRSKSKAVAAPALLNLQRSPRHCWCALRSEIGGLACWLPTVPVWVTEGNDVRARWTIVNLSLFHISDLPNMLAQHIGHSTIFFWFPLLDTVITEYHIMCHWLGKRSKAKVCSLTEYMSPLQKVKPKRPIFRSQGPITMMWEIYHLIHIFWLGGGGFRYQ